ncbi:MAG: integrase core domain-containing protein [Pseudomonadota bacterium]
MACHLIRAGIQISRATVQRVLREEQPHRPRRLRPALVPPADVAPCHLLTPELPNRVWHLDLTVLQVFWFRYTVAALLDGFSRKLLRLQVYRRTPTCGDMVGLVRRAGHEFGIPRFLITDHGCQFRRQFKHTIEALSITHVQGRVRSASFNGKAERLFRTLRQWYRLSLLPLSLRSFQRRLDRFRAWHNIARPHQSLDAMTPEEVWSGTALPEPIPLRAADPQPVAIEIK